MFGDSVPNDEGLMPLRMCRQQEYDPAVLARACFEQIDSDFAAGARPGDFVVAGLDFAHGNPHIQGFLALRALSVGVLAESMSRGPLRACVNAGVPVLVVPGVCSFARGGDALAVNFQTGLLTNLTTGAQLQAKPLPAVMQEIVVYGGGLGYMKMRLGL